MARKPIEQVLQEYADEWMSIPGVVGTAVGELNARPCIKVFAVKKTEQLTKRIPSRVEGFPVVIVETGRLRALDTD